MRTSNHTFEKYWGISTSKKDVDEYVDILRKANTGTDFPRYNTVKRLMVSLAQRAWISSAKSIRKDFDIVWEGNKWRIRGVIQRTPRTKARKAKPRVVSVIEVVREPKFVGPESFSSISVGEVFEYEGEYYKKLPYELSQQKRNGKPLGIAVSLIDEGVYHFLRTDMVIACDVRCSISYVFARQDTVLEGQKEETDD